MDLYITFFFYHGAPAPSGPRPPHYRGFTISLRRTTVGRTPPDEQSARRRDIYLTTYNTHQTDIHAHREIRIQNPIHKCTMVRNKSYLTLGSAYPTSPNCPSGTNRHSSHSTAVSPKPTDSTKPRSAKQQAIAKKMDT